MDAVRVGIMLYGYGARYAEGEPQRPIERAPFLQWKARVIQIRDVPAGFPVSYEGTYVTPAATRIATVSAGYADGYPRRVGNRAFVLVGGQRRPVLGRVTMNFMCVGLGPGVEVAEGDEVVLLGT